MSDLLFVISVVVFSLTWTWIGYRIGYLHGKLDGIEAARRVIRDEYGHD